MKIFALARAHTELLAALPALGITLAEGQSLAQAIQSRIESATTTPAPAQIEAAALALLSAAGLPALSGAPSASSALAAFVAEFEQREANLATAQASLATVHAALAKSGVKIAPAAKAADIEAALSARVSARAAELLGQTGTPLVDTTPCASVHTGDPKVKTKAEFAALNPREKMEFSTKGGRLSD